jgi:hypothetical protein
VLAVSLLLVATALPPVLADPRQGDSGWAVVGAEGELPEPGASGYLLRLPAPPAVAGQGWLERAVTLGARGVPVVTLGNAAPPQALLRHLDGVCIEPAPADDEIAAIAGTLGGVPLVLVADDAAGVVRLLALGANAVLVREPPESWRAELVSLLPEAVPAHTSRGELPTALRGSDMAAVIGAPRAHPAGELVLPGPWYDHAELVTETRQPLVVRRDRSNAIVALPVLPNGGLVVAQRARDSSSAFERVAVTGEQLPTAEEVLARHQRVASRTELLVPRWRAEQRLLVRVFVAELGRSFEVVFAGPAFWEKGVGTDWEIARAWVDGVAWKPDQLPDLPLLEPKRPPVPPLALRLQPTYRYRLTGVEERAGYRCFALRYEGEPGSEKANRHGVAYIDAASFALVELHESAEGLTGEVRSTHSVLSFAPVAVGTETLWLPSRVVADDLLSVFGGAATVHRELTLDGLTPNPPDLERARALAYARPYRMLRDAPGGVAPLVPDGRGGRTVGGETRPAQRFLIGGVVWDPGLSFPVPFGGLQLQDFRFRGRDQQLRLLLAGVVNDGAFAARHGRLELSARAFTQLLAFDNSVFVRGHEQDGEEINLRRQRIGGALASSVGPIRIGLDLGLERWDFARTDNTAKSFVLPADTWEGVAKLEATAVLGATTIALAGESGWRHDWRAWGMAGSEPVQDSWQRGKLSVAWEKAPYPLARLRLASELWLGRHLDRFSAPSPARFGGIRLRGIASGRVLPERLAVVSASLATPLSARVRGEIGIDAAWAREKRSGYENRPLCGVGVGFTVPGPWGTLVQGSLGMPLTTPGARQPTAELFVLKPLGHS